MGYVGTGQTGHTYIGSGIGASGTFKQMGTNSGLTAHGVVVAEGNNPFVAVGPTATTGAVLQNNAGADPSYSTASYPSTTVAGSILYSPSANVVDDLSTTASATLVSNSSAVPVWTSAMTNGQVVIGSTGGTPTAATPSSVGGNYLVGAGSLDYRPANYEIGYSNLGATYSGGTYTIHGYNGTALSATNPAYITMRSRGSAYQLKTIAVTANQSFTDGSAGSIDNARFGVTTGVNWAFDVPFYIYAVMNDAEDTIAFMISRAVGVIVAPAAASISKSGSIVNVSAADFYCLPDVTVADYDSNPLLLVGAFRMQFAGATDSWQVQATGSAIQDGIGMYHEYSVFTGPPAGQNGAAASSLFMANGGTAPTFSSISCHYQIDPWAGRIHYFVNVQGDAGTDGAGAVAAQLVLPYPNNTTVNTGWQGAFNVKYAGATTIAANLYMANAGYGQIYNLTTGASILNSNFTNGDRYIVGDMIYRALTY